MRFIVRACGAHATFYLVQKDDGYAWKNGMPGYEEACRFNTEGEARTAINAGHRGAAGVVAEIISTED